MKSTQYLAREPDDSGFIHYPEAEHQVWNTLITRQLKVIEGRACQEYLDGIEQLGLPLERIPQLGEINRVLEASTGDRVGPLMVGIRPGADPERVVAQLNACHEDNYYLANGLLTWGGAVAEGNEVLRRAMNCRFWDGIPPFFYGVNLAFFEKDKTQAVQALELSAERWPENAVTLRRMAIMLRAEALADERLAVNYLMQQRDTTHDPKLREMLDKRVIRLQGLIDLRAAQRRYEEAHGPLQDFQQLVDSGEMAMLPQDPLRLGYELRDGRIEFRELKIPGMENQQ